jgi:hypothetical protein
MIAGAGRGLYSELRRGPDPPEQTTLYHGEGLVKGGPYV